MKDAILVSEMSVNFYHTAKCRISEDSTLHSHQCENFKSLYKYILHLISYVYKHRTVTGCGLDDYKNFISLTAEPSPILESTQPPIQ
jgi:hypothetical protein